MVARLNISQFRGSRKYATNADARSFRDSDISFTYHFAAAVLARPTSVTRTTLRKLRSVAAVASLSALANISGAAGKPGVVTLVDGDTLKYEGETIRLVDIDTTESFRSRCERELVLALEAKARLRQLVAAGPLTIERQGQDRYGRTLARVVVAGRDVGDTLLRESKALRYRPGQADKLSRLRQWCGPDAQLEDKWKARD
jgi:endonuclease YncB( thermonuclease family)